MTDEELHKLMKPKLMDRIFPIFSWQYKLKEKISCFFNPRQKWLTKVIPNTWCDKPELIRDILFATLVDYVEEEDGFAYDHDWSEAVKDGFVSQEFADNKAKTYEELRETYNYIKNIRPPLLEEMDVLLDMADDGGRYIEAEDTLTNLDTEACLTIVKHRGNLWT